MPSMQAYIYIYIYRERERERGSRFTGEVVEEHVKSLMLTIPNQSLHILDERVRSKPEVARVGSTLLGRSPRYTDQVMKGTVIFS